MKYRKVNNIYLFANNNFKYTKIIGTPKRNDNFFMKSLIAFVNAEININKIKVIISLKKLLEKGKNLQKLVEDNTIVYSYHGVASNALLRKATINDTLNGKTSPQASTLISIVEAMEFTMTDFGKEFDSISELEIQNYLEEH